MKFTTFGRTATVRTALLAGAAALVLPNAAAAQDVGDDAEIGEVEPETEVGNVIVVTATKRQQTLQEVPVAVSVTTAETIERAQIRDLKDLQTQVPSLRVNQLQSSANTNFLIRGFGNGANNAGIEPSVGVFVDGVYRSRTASQITDLPDVQRVEVLRGPQSTLFGKNASAGVISIVTKEPEFEFGGTAEISYGNYDAIVAKGLVTGPIADSLAFSLAGGINKRDGYLSDLATGNDSNERDRWFTRGQLLFDNGGPFTARLIGDYDKIDEICCGAVNLQRSPASNAILALGGQIPNPNDPFADVIYNNFDSTNDIENWGVSGELGFEIGDFTLTSITAYRESRAITDQDSDFTSADLIGSNFADVGLETFTQELRVAGNIADRIDFLLGAFYFNEDIDQQNRLIYGEDFREYANILIGGPVTSPPNDFAVQQLEGTLSALNGQNYAGQFFAAGQGLNEAYTLSNEALSIFGQVDFEIVDGLVLTLGANYTDDSKEISTNVVSSDVFSGIDLVQSGNRAIFAQGLATQVGTLLGLGRPATQAEIGAFAAGNPAAFGQVSAGVQAFADANQNNPAVNPLLALQPLQFLPPFLNVPNSVEDGQTDDSDWSYTARLAYDISPFLNIYASYATGFKASSFNLSRDSRPLASDLAAVRGAGIAPVNLRPGSRFAGPEETEVYELGLKGNWDILSANLTFFNQRIEGFQTNLFTGTGFALANAGLQETFGIEFDSVVRVSDSFSVLAAFTYLEPEYVDFPNSSIGNLSGAEVAGISEFTMAIGAQYDKEINANGDRIILNTNFYHEAPVQIADGLPAFFDPRNPASQEAAFAAARPFRRQVDELSASATYSFGFGLDLTVWGRNLLDDRYITTIFDSVAQTGSISGYPNQPRTYGVAAKYRF
ncbi:TonB-dependent receptor [Qipengyuania sp. XHP0207]|uniref:TonB-dependent receptor n=1 Tax=Qipengyuania sp. XHP0207 TaxID=3038078 RepID=UPI00241DAB4D|nr:TonB-dependent receptor [Qipengyuania sp. XHP0207]MDG5746991.1 TonB-dependent receptor [Qipengyuania sp. XHP0207]